MATAGGLVEEQQPLLFDSSHPNELSKPTVSRPSSTGVVIYIAIIVCCLSLAGDLVSIPIVRIIEDVVCKDYYRPRGGQSLLIWEGIDEKLCKQDEIQSELA